MKTRKVSTVLMMVIIFAAQVASAGKIKMSWDQQPNATAPTPTAYRMYWGLKGEPLNKIIELGSVNPKDPQTHQFQLSMSTPDWPADQDVCFEITGYIFNNNKIYESTRSKQACKHMESQGPAQNRRAADGHPL